MTKNQQPFSRKQRAFRPLFIVALLSVGAFTGWLLWPSNPEIDAHQLSKADGRSRFYATTYSQRQMLPGLTLRGRLLWLWVDFNRRRGKSIGTFSFPASPVQPCSIQGLLNQCMEVTGTQYLLAVEVHGVVEFGTSNVLNGRQWATAFERALQTSKPVTCYDYATRRNFQDTLLLIREGPKLVKIVPRTKLAEYKKAGLVRSQLP